MKKRYVEPLTECLPEDTSCCLLAASVPISTERETEESYSRETDMWKWQDE